ncbi:uncharacterized protein LOC131585221 isoform X3 [Poecile atricapillus]|uniref:uncharacterized protein LOC131585221 isoform X3 n=1 Tax=Poecile atricapillus TaxID=48891 RepID=UPI0027382BA2|nr:uncharacterized protein LOC131585221 isoform X3 [Poecile atricapillus]
MARPGEEQAAAGGVTGQPVPPRWSLRSRQEGTREPGSGAEPWSKGDRARTGLALLGHTWDTNHRCHTDLQRMSWQGQRACVGQEWLDKEKTSQEEKLELLELIPALPQPRPHCPAAAPAANPAAPRAVAEAGESPGSRRTQAGGDSGAGRKDTEPMTASAPFLTPGAFPLGASPGSVPEQDGEQRQQPEKVPAPGAPREPLVQGQREHPHPSLALSSRGLLQQLQQHFQELQLEKTRDTGSPTALGDNRAPERSPGASPGWGLPLCHRPSADPRKGRGAELHHGAEFPVGTALRQVPPAPPHGTSDPRVTVGS